MGLNQEIGNIGVIVCLLWASVNDGPFVGFDEVVPVMLFVQAKITGFVHGLFKKNIATIGVGYPATDVAEERTRFCVSASHTKEMLDKVIDSIQELSDQDLHICYSRKKKYVNAEIVY